MLWESDRLTLSAVPASVAKARSYTRGRLLGWGLAYALDDVELIVSELVTNAVRATSRTAAAGPFPAPGLIGLRLEPARATLLIEVWDRDITPPHHQSDAAPEDESGRGLLLVGALAKQWGSRPAANGGKIVWCEYALR